MQGIIFDMDGVLFDTERLSASVMKAVGRDMGVVVSDELIQSLCSAPRKAYETAMYQEFGQEFNLAYYDARYETDFAKLLKKELPQKEGLHEVLHAAHALGLKCAVASSTKRWRVLEYLERAQITNQFEVVFGGDNVVNEKPDPEIYKKAAGELGLLPSQCFAVEDSRNGIKSASSAGCVTIMVPDLTPPDDEIRNLVTHVCDSLFNVIDIIRANNDSPNCTSHSG